MNLADPGRQVQPLGGLLELPLGVGERVELFLNVGPFGSHRGLQSGGAGARIERTPSASRDSHGKSAAV